eukprot:s2313_g9.t1
MVRSSRLALLAGLAQALMVSELFTAPRPRPGRPRPGGPRLRSICRASPEDYWKVLGVPSGTSVKEVKRAYRRRAKEEHPDVNKSPGALKRWQKLSEAYGKLIDPEYRKKWSEEEARRSARTQESRRTYTSNPGTSTNRADDIREPPATGFPKTRDAKKWAAAGWDAFQDILRRADSLRQPRGYRDASAVREFQASKEDLAKAQQKLKQLSSDEEYYLNLTESYQRSGQKREELRAGLRTLEIREELKKLRARIRSLSEQADYWRSVVHEEAPKLDEQDALHILNCANLLCIGSIQSCIDNPTGSVFTVQQEEPALAEPIERPVTTSSPGTTPIDELASLKGAISDMPSQTADSAPPINMDGLDPRSQTPAGESTATGEDTQTPTPVKECAVQILATAVISSLVRWQSTAEKAKIMVITILAGGELTIQTIGACLVFFATRTCHWAFAECPALLWQCHAKTMSETFGDTSTTEFQIVEATARPAAHLLLLGNVMMHLKGGDIFSCCLPLAQSGIIDKDAPFGLMMVMNTPVISGAGGSNARMRQYLPVSDLDTLYVFQWVLLHLVGFFFFLGPTTLIELPVAVLELFNPPELAEGETWLWAPQWHASQYCLEENIRSSVCPILLLRALPILFSDKVTSPNTWRMKKWYAEFCVGEPGSVVMYFNAVSVFVLPGRSYGFLDAAAVQENFFLLEVADVWGIWSLWLLHAWDTIDFKYECMARSTMSQGPEADGPTAGRLSASRGQVFLHAVQAGHYDPTEWCVTSSPVPKWLVNGALGVAQGPVRQFVLRPELYENFHAFDFLDVQDMLAVLDALPTATTLFFPFGDHYKKKVRRPFLCLSCADFDAEVARIAGPKQQANTNLPEADDTDEAQLCSPSTQYYPYGRDPAQLSRACVFSPLLIWQPHLQMLKMKVP